MATYSLNAIRSPNMQPAPVGAPQPFAPAQSSRQQQILEMIQQRDPRAMQGVSNAMTPTREQQVLDMIRARDPRAMEGVRNAFVGGLESPDPTVSAPIQQNLEQSITAGQTEERPFATYSPMGPLTGVIGSTEAINRGTSGGLAELEAGTGEAVEALEGATGTAREDIMRAIRGGRVPLEDYAGAGTAANRRQAALSGALGPEAQRQAYAEFVESPGQKYLTDKAMQAVQRWGGITGKTGSGELLNRLQQEAVGLAAQDFADAFSRLGDVSGRGIDAAGALGQLGQGEASLLSNLSTTTGTNLARILADKGVRGSDIYTRAGESLADIRQTAGQDIAGGALDTGSALSELIAEQGTTGREDVMGGTEALVKLLTGYGELDAETQRVLGNLLAELGVTEGQSLADLYAATGRARMGGDLRGAEQFREGVGDLADFAGDIGDILSIFQ